MTTARKHRFSSGPGFGDPYAGFTLELDADGQRDPFRIDPTDSHAIADLLDPEHYTPEDVDADALLEVGLGYLAIEEYESAVDAFARVAWFGPGSRAAVEAWVNRGVAHGQLGEYDEAIGAYLEALSLDPDPGVAAVAETNLAYALWESGDSSNPLEHAERAVELDPRLAEAWYDLGFLYNERGLAGDAARALENAARLGFDRRVVREELDRAHERLGEYETVEEGEAVETDTDAGVRAGSEREREADHGEREAAGDGSASRERLGA
jgi:tetratricopeptide (TPR) repeat protein